MSPGDLDTDRAQVVKLGECKEQLVRVLAGTEDVRTYAQGYADALAWALAQVEGMREHAQQTADTHHSESMRVVSKLRVNDCAFLAALLRGREG